MGAALCWLAVSLFTFFLGLRLTGNLSLAAPARLERLLLRATATPTRALLVGLVVTALVHSSSAVTLATVALVSAGLLPLQNALGVVLGSNVGTCTTVQFLAFDFTRFAFPLAGMGAAAAAVLRGRWRRLALGLTGFGLLLSALALLSRALTPLAALPFFSRLLTHWTDTAPRAFLAGVLATGLIQSSTIFTAAVMTLADQGFFALPQAIALVLGGNVGTCADTLVAAICGNHAGRRVALAHLALNLGGAVLFFPCLGPFATLVSLTGLSPARQVANAHLLFNLITALIALPFVRPLARRLE